MRRFRGALAAALLLALYTRALAQEAMEPGEEEEVVEDHTQVVKKKEQKPQPAKPVAPPTKPAPPKPAATKPAVAAKPAPPKPAPPKPAPPKPAPPKPARPPVAAEPAPVAPPAGGGRASVFVYAYTGRGVDPAAIADVTTAACSALDANRYTLVDLEPLYGDQPRAAAELAAADDQVKQALDLLNQLEIDAADGALDSAIRAYEVHLVGLLARDAGLGKLAEAQAARAVARYLDGDVENAQKQLQRAFVIDPNVSSSKLFPPDMGPMIARERTRFEELGTGSLDVKTPGVAAQIIVNGQEVATSPAHFDALPVGVSYVTLSARNHPTITITATIQPGETTQLTEELPRYQGDPVARLDAAESEVGGKKLGPKLRAAAQAAGQPDRMLLIKTRPSEDGVRVAAFLYDTRTGALVGKNEGDAVISDPFPAVDKVVKPLYALSIELPVPKPHHDEPAGPPLWERRWFWPAVGVVGAAVLLTGAIVAAQGLSDGERTVVIGVVF